MLEVKSIELVEANEIVRSWHRHHEPVHRDKFRCAATQDGNIVGVVQIGRPVSRCLDDGQTCEVVRLATDGTKNACSFLYARAANAARELGFKRIITYILADEPGTTLLAAGWTLDGIIKGKSWSCPSRPRQTTAPACDKKRFVKLL